MLSSACTPSRHTWTDRRGIRRERSVTNTSRCWRQSEQGPLSRSHGRIPGVPGSRRGGIKFNLLRPNIGPYEWLPHHLLTGQKHARVSDMSFESKGRGLALWGRSLRAGRY